MQSHIPKKRRTANLFVFLLVLLLGVFILQFGDRAVDTPQGDKTALESDPESSLNERS